jgi:hypothetical protein
MNINSVTGGSVASESQVKVLNIQREQEEKVVGKIMESIQSAPEAESSSSRAGYDTGKSVNLVA